MKKEYRIKKNDEIQSLMQKRKTVGNTYFVIYHYKNHDQEHFRYALSVPKKFGNAVQRNQMKRRIREIIKDCSIIDKVDVFIIAKLKSQELSFNDIKINIQNLLKKAKILKDGKYEKQE
ncbi:MAG: ribonuclease P protein component [Candidatus Izemoplasmatales bacterium]